MSRIIHPVWIRPRSDDCEAILGDCLASPIKNIDVTVANDYLDDPRIEAEMQCTRYIGGAVIDRPFPLMDSADTNTEQTHLAIESVKIALNGICCICPFRSTVG